MTPHMPDFPFRSVDSLRGAEHAGPKGPSGYVHVAKHFAVMVVLMYAGMIVLDPLYDLTAEVAGVSDPSGRLPVLTNVSMALNMTVPMVLYMRHQRHTWRAIGEMSAAMLLPAALTMGPYFLGILTAATMMTLSHATMIPLMMVAMILRFREYAHPSQAQNALRNRLALDKRSFL
ncbi:hypothetical protein [Arthrobacter sp. UYCu712]|uniref:hypothetical protein n=1 Tax=Arthrobacter sp. UYCu712 TaxID=3156340 RepID=UPI003390FF3E